MEVQAVLLTLLCYEWDCVPPYSSNPPVGALTPNVIVFGEEMLKQ